MLHLVTVGITFVKWKAAAVSKASNSSAVRSCPPGSTSMLRSLDFPSGISFGGAMTRSITINFEPVTELQFVGVVKPAATVDVGLHPRHWRRPIATWTGDAPTDSDTFWPEWPDKAKPEAQIWTAYYPAQLSLRFGPSFLLIHSSLALLDRLTQKIGNRSSDYCVRAVTPLREKTSGDRGRECRRRLLPRKQDHLDLPGIEGRRHGPIHIQGRRTASSSHRLSLKVRDVLGQELQSLAITLECFIPRSVGTRLHPTHGTSTNPRAGPASGTRS